MENWFCIYNGETDNNKNFVKNFIESTHTWVCQKSTFPGWFHMLFPLVSKSLKIHFLLKNLKYLKCEIQNTNTFEVKCSKMIQIFRLKNVPRFVILLWQSFWYIKIWWKKSWIFEMSEKFNFLRRKFRFFFTFLKIFEFLENLENS